MLRNAGVFFLSQVLQWKFYLWSRVQALELQHIKVDFCNSTWSTQSTFWVHHRVLFVAQNINPWVLSGGWFFFLCTVFINSKVTEEWATVPLEVPRIFDSKNWFNKASEAACLCTKLQIKLIGKKKKSVCYHLMFPKLQTLSDPCCNHMTVIRHCCCY